MAPQEELEESHQDSHLHSTVLALASDMQGVVQCDAADTFNKKLSDLLAKRQAPMLVLDSKVLAEIGHLPSYNQIEAKLVPVDTLSADDLVVFVSHRWWRPAASQPDGDYNEKVSIVLALIDEYLASKSLNQTVFLWWDYFSITQTDHGDFHRCDKGAQILAIPFYLGCCDGVLALRGGDEDAYLFAHESEHPSKHHGLYNNRVWTMLELYGFTSDFARSCSRTRTGGNTRDSTDNRFILDVQLGFKDSQLQTESVSIDGRLRHYRSMLHDTDSWTLPPSAHLTSSEDFKYIEPTLIALSSITKMCGQDLNTQANNAADNAVLSQMLSSACRFGFETASQTFIELGAPVNLPDRITHCTPLMVAIQANKPLIVKMLLGGRASPTELHCKTGVDSLHIACQLTRWECLLTMLNAGFDATKSFNSLGRTPLHMIAGCSQTANAYEDHKIDALKHAIEALIEAGVDPTRTDHAGRRATDLALSKNNQQMLEIVESMLTEEQRAACLPRVAIPLELDSPDRTLCGAQCRGRCLYLS